MENFDQLYRFLFTKAKVRGELVRLEHSLQSVLAAQDYPAPIKQLLAELMAATSLLTATLKFDGEISLQVQSEGPLKYAVVHGSSEQALRGVAKWQGDMSGLSLRQMAPKGLLAINIIPEQGERYQGIVALDKDTLAQCLEGYFYQSEQLPTKILLHTTMGESTQLVSGMLLQVIPESAASSHDQENEDFMRLCMLTDTLTPEEATLLPAQDILHRLYHEEDVEVFAPTDVSFSCTCSRDKCVSALRGMDKQELLQIVAEEQTVKMNCQYCHQEYAFDAIDIEAMFTGAVAEQRNQ